MADQPISKSRRDDIELSKLDFDPANPRFPPEIASGPTAKLLERFIRDERLLEIVYSIGDQNFFEGEPLLVVPNGDHFTVIEGNRRLAALKLLSGELKAPDGRVAIEEACEGATHRPDRIPCLVFDHTDEILRYLAYRHITGIKPWSSLQKARYLKRMRDTFYQGYDQKEQLIHLAREIGSRHDYVGQTLASLNLYERAERENFYGVSGLNPDEIEFSVLSTALGYKNIVSFIGLDSRQDMSGANVSDENLKNLLTWMFVARGDQKPILGDSRNLSKLAAIVDSDTARANLIQEGNLEAAFLLSKGPAQALHLSLKAVYAKLQDTWKWLPLVDTPDPSDESKAEDIRKLALELREAIKSKRASADE